MIEKFSLLKETSAYKTIVGEKKAGRLSHAYLFLTPDGDTLREYLKFFACAITCEEFEPCLNCRKCNLILEEKFSDLIIYPKDGDTINSEQINNLIEESFLKPIEGERKIFILSNAQNMNIQAQNKLLKTLEEPPKNVHILMGATSEFALLPTIKSRVEKLEIAPFSNQKLFSVLTKEFDDEEKLKNAIACGDGTVGRAISLYNDQNLKVIEDLVCEVILDMQSSKDLLKYSVKISSSKCDLGDFLSILELVLRDMLVAKTNPTLVSNLPVFERVKNAKGYTEGALITALEKVIEAQKRKKSNANPTMLIEWVLFQILEGKYKWQKL